MKPPVNLGYMEIDAMEPGPEKAAQYAICGLLTDGAHHKQWCLEEVLTALGVDMDDLRQRLIHEEQCDWEPGIAP